MHERPALCRLAPRGAERKRCVSLLAAPSYLLLRKLDGPYFAIGTWVLAETFRLSWPLALANLLQMLTYAVDVIFIARLGEEPLAASAVAVALFGLVLWALCGLTGAVAPLIAEEIGARAPALRPIRRATRMALWLSVITGAVGMGLCLLLDPLMRATGQQPAIIALSNQYNLLIIWSLAPMLVNNVLRSFVSALGRPVFATAITASGIAVNALAN